MAISETLQDTNQAPRNTRIVGLLRVFGPTPCDDPWLGELPIGTLVLGREPGTDGLALADGGISRQHAAITFTAVGRPIVVRDLDSRNGTWLNGQKISETKFAPGSILRLGDTVLALVELDADLIGAPKFVHPSVVARSHAMGKVLHLAAAMAKRDAPILITGETGVGKDVVAKVVHDSSKRTGDFCVVNCAALPHHLVESELFGSVRGAFSGAEQNRKGVFQAAENGTLFLDEIGELPIDLQAKILRAVETRQIRPLGASKEISVDVKIVAATLRNLATEESCGRFRPDLLARLSEYSLQIPPLRKRLDDIEPLFQHFYRLAETHPTNPLWFKGPAAEALALYAWPFNARDIRRVVAHVTLHQRGQTGVQLTDLPEEFYRPAERDLFDRGALSEPPPAPNMEAPLTPSKETLQQLLVQHEGNVRTIALHFGKNRNQIYRWLKSYGLDPNDFRRT